MIQKHVLDSLTETVANKITKARLNSSTTMTVRKVRTGNMLVVDFLVPDTIHEVRKVELLDDTSVVITSIDVFLPIETSTRFKYQMEVVTDG